MEAYARSKHVMFRHPITKRPVIMGGDINGAVQADAWEWSGKRFSKISPEPGSYPTLMPSGRSGAAVATLPDGRVVLFGGYTGSNILVDMWELGLDGAWRRIQLQGGSWPQGRHGHSMTFDPVSRRVLLFGGQTSGGLKGDTWAWDPDTRLWAQLTTSVTPASRYGAGMAVYAGIVHMYGGIDGSGPRSDFYRWNGADWEAIAATGPGARGGLLLLESDGYLLAIGGQGSGASYAYDGETWSQASALQLPNPAVWSAGLSDSFGGTTVGGVGVASGLLLEQVWEHQGDAGWLQVDVEHASEPPSSRSALLAWNAEAGLTQLLTDGGMILGSSRPGMKRKLKVGDKIRIEQIGDPIGPMFGINGTFSCQELPEGLAWKVSLLVNDIECASRVFDRAVKNVTLEDMVIPSRTGTVTNKKFTIQLELVQK